MLTSEDSRVLYYPEIAGAPRNSTPGLFELGSRSISSDENGLRPVTRPIGTFPFSRYYHSRKDCRDVIKMAAHTRSTTFQRADSSC